MRPHLKSFYIFLWILAFFYYMYPSASWARPATPALGEEKEIKSLRGKVKTLEEDINHLKVSVVSLDHLQTQLSHQLNSYEDTFISRFRDIVIPLLNWPTNLQSAQLSSWIEHEHMKVVLLDARERIVREPLELISDRELRIERAARMKSDFSEALKTLESKQTMLNLQLEELRSIHKRSKKSSRKGLTDANAPAVRSKELYE